MDTVAQRIFNRRIELKMTQQYVATKVGVSRVAVTKWENGQTGNLKLDNLIALCKLLNLSIEYLIQGGELQPYLSVSSPSPRDKVKDELEIETENINVLRAEVHQGVSRALEKDLPQIKKLLELMTKQREGQNQERNLKVTPISNWCYEEQCKCKVR